MPFFLTGRVPHRVIAVFTWAMTLMGIARYEAYPEYFSRTLAGYGGLLARDVLISDSWMRILYRKTPIGYSHTQMDTDPSSPTHYRTLNNRVQVRLNLMGEKHSLRLDTYATLDVFNQLQTFTFSLSSAAYAATVRGRRTRANTYLVITETGAGRHVQHMDIPDDVVLYSPMTELAIKNLQPGHTLTLRTLDPVTVTAVPLTLRALRRERIAVSGHDYAVTALAVDYQNTTVRAWVTHDGQMIRQETPIGWVLETCTMDEAFAALEAADCAGDMLSGLAVPCRGRLVNPHRVRAIRLRLRGVRFQPGELESPRQTVEVLRDDVTELRVTAATLPPSSPPLPAPWMVSGERPPETFRPYLQSSPTIQSTHPEVVARARALVGGHTHPLDRVLRLYDFVHRNVQKRITVSLPTTLDVLRRLEGDCNEHTYLMVGLARAAGIPAKIMVGLAYHKSAFYYHAWPAVYVGEWLEMDPTWGQRAVDATHVALLEGDLVNQMKLMKAFGQLRAEILSEEGQRSPADGQTEFRSALRDDDGTKGEAPHD